MGSKDQRHAANEHRGADAGSGALGCRAGELRSYLNHLSDQIADADRRHSETLQDMRDRLSRLSGQAQALKGVVPHEIEANLERVESGADALASRIDAHEARRHTNTEPPPALRSAVPADASKGYSRSPDGHGWSEPASPTVALDPDLEPWDLQSADALSRAYEATDIALPVTPAVIPDVAKVAVPSQPEVAMFTGTPQSSPTQQVSARAMFAAAPAAAEQRQTDEEHRRWLEDKLSEVATRVEQSLLQIQPDHSLDNLSERFDLLEERWSSALTDVATRSDVEGLRLVEAHIAELATRIESAHDQLSRLDSIESQIAELGSKLTDDEIVRLFGGLVPSEEELLRFAETAAMSAAERTVSQSATAFAGMGHASGPAHAASFDTETLIPSLVEATREASSERLISLEHLLQAHMDEGRKGSSDTADALETIQHALQHLLDRQETFETKQAELAEKAALHAAASYRPRTEPAMAAREAPGMGASPAPSDDLNVSAARAAARAAAAGAANRRQAPIDAISRPPTGPADLASDSDDDLIFAPRAGGADAPARGRPIPRPQMPAASEAQRNGDKAPSLRDRFFGGEKSSSRAGILLVPSVLALMIAGYYLVISPKKHPAQSASARIEQPVTSTPEAKPNSPVMDEKVAPKPTKDAPTAPNKQGAIDGSGNATQSADAKDATDAAEAASRVRLAGAGIAIQHDARGLSGDELLRARERVRIAELSGQAAQNAAATSVQLGAAPREVVADMHRTSATPAAVQPEQTQQEATTVELPPATIGPMSLRLAAAKGDRSAQFEIAARFAEGKGVKQDFGEAANWYQRAAAQGVPVAQYRLAALYERGLGVKADAARARIWYKRAAEQGNVKAMHNLAVLSASRSNGGADYATAAQWFSEAADRGLADSQYNLGVLHESGLGVPKNVVSAYKWYAIAAERGDKEATRRRDQLKTRLDAGSLALAEKAIKAWHPQLIDRNANDALVAGTDWKRRTAQATTR